MIAAVKHIMDGQGQKYLTLITHSVNAITSSASDSTRFEKHYTQLQAVVPQYGLTLHQLNQLLDIVVDAASEFKNPVKRKLTSLLYCRELLDFRTVLKIISVFKVTTYYNEKSRLKIVPKMIQIRLSLFLLNNFVNIKWDRNFLLILNTLFDTLSIGYLRYNLSLFLIYLLGIADRIDPTYNLRYFFNIKKCNIILEFHDLDPKSSLPLLLYTHLFLNSYDKGDSFDILALKYQMVLNETRIPKDVFGKINHQFINSLIEMNSNPARLDSLTENLEWHGSTLAVLNSTVSLTLLTNNNKRKRHSDVSISDALLSTNACNVGNMTLSLCGGPISRISALEYLLTINDKHYDQQNILDGLNIKMHFSTASASFIPLLKCLISLDNKILDSTLRKILNVKENMFEFKGDMTWLFQVMATLLSIGTKLPPVVDEMLTGYLGVEFGGTREEAVYSACVHKVLPYLAPDYDKYGTIIELTLDTVFKTNDSKTMSGIVLLASAWVSEPDQFYRLMSSIFKRFKWDNLALINEMLILCTISQTIPPELIDMGQMILKPDFVLACLFSGDVFKLNLLLQHFSFCENHYARSARWREEGKHQERALKYKGLHDRYMEDIKRLLVAESRVDQPFFTLPAEFTKILQDNRRLNLLHIPALQSITPGLTSTALDHNDTALVLDSLRQHSFWGIHNFLYSCTPELQKIRTNSLS